MATFFVKKVKRTITTYQVEADSRQVAESTVRTITDDGATLPDGVTLSDGPNSNEWVRVRLKQS